ncbi:MAG: hypothetical protein ACI9DF_005230 [Verrucomicrobiales bacterium]
MFFFIISIVKVEASLLFVDFESCADGEYTATELDAD